MRNLSICLAVIITSLYFFPFDVKALPGVNTKLAMAVLGLIVMFIHWVQDKGVELNRTLFVSSIIAFVFSVSCAVSVFYNNTPDYDYVTYLVSMWVWYAAAYFVCYFITFIHGYISIRLLANYLVAVCVTQCALALMIDFIPPFKNFVDNVLFDGNVFLNDIDRLYGIGAALDAAGMKFGIVMVLISVLLLSQYNITSKKKETRLYMISFVIIAIVGNMIARTATVGMVLGIAYLIYGTRFWTGILKGRTLKIWRWFATILIIMLVGVVFLYNTVPQIHGLLRFGFEGFFNWLETGSWETDSTDKLQTMWVFPDNTKTWLIGDGRFMDPFREGIFYMQTDAGYSRFIFYCGLIGLSIFSSFFIYLSFRMKNYFHYYKEFFILLLALVFINWVKVATDLFVMYAFFLAMMSPHLSRKYNEKDLT